MREDSLAAPELIDTEFLSALRRMEREGKIPTHRCQQAIDDYRQLLLVRYPSAGLIDDIWALRHNFTTYDAAYVALAKVLKARLITCDAKLARAATGMIETILV